jgi:hypothetical protein
LQNNIAFFDFDGTITRKDTMFEMVKFSHGKKEFYKGLLKITPWLVGLKLGLVSAQKAKEELENGICGFLVDFPLDFLSRENNFRPEVTTKEGLMPDDLWV